VYSNKRLLKQNEDGIFVTEKLTQFRTSLIKTLSKLKYEHKIHTYWTSDGRIFAKKTSEGRKKIINNFDDIVKNRKFVNWAYHVLFLIDLLVKALAI
jgi:hypothetical protein